MKVVTEIETVDGQYCFCLRNGERDLVLFVFRTEKEAQIASDALCQIAEHAVDILPATETRASDGNGHTQTDAGAEDENTEVAADSPFLER